MKPVILVVAGLGLAAGSLGGLRAYSLAATTPPAPAPTAVVHHLPAQPVRPGVVVRWAPCHKPAVRVGRACVTHVVHTVTVPVSTTTQPTGSQASSAASPGTPTPVAPAAAPPAAPSAAPATASASPAPPTPSPSAEPSDDPGPSGGDPGGDDSGGPDR